MHAGIVMFLHEISILPSIFYLHQLRVAEKKTRPLLFYFMQAIAFSDKGFSYAILWANFILYRRNIIGHGLRSSDLMHLLSPPLAIAFRFAELQDFF